jgi:hypothetical protein
VPNCRTSSANRRSGFAFTETRRQRLVRGVMTDKCKISATLPIERLCIIDSMNLRKWLMSAAHPATVRRARITSLIVGTVLVAINHGAAILTGQLTRERVFQMLLTFAVPYLVSTTSSVLTRNEMKSAPASAFQPTDTLFESTSRELIEEDAPVSLAESAF